MVLSYKGIPAAQSLCPSCIVAPWWGWTSETGFEYSVFLISLIYIFIFQICPFYSFHFWSLSTVAFIYLFQNIFSFNHRRLMKSWSEVFFFFLPPGFNLAVNINALLMQQIVKENVVFPSQGLISESCVWKHYGYSFKNKNKIPCMCFLCLVSCLLPIRLHFHWLFSGRKLI